MDRRALPVLQMDNILHPFSQEPVAILEVIMLINFVRLSLMKQIDQGQGNRPFMAKVEIDRDRCKGCGLCTISCPKELIRIGEEMNQYGYFCARWDGDEKCTGCAICGEACPDVAIRVWRERGRTET